MISWNSWRLMDFTCRQSATAYPRDADCFKLTCCLSARTPRSRPESQASRNASGVRRTQTPGLFWEVLFDLSLLCQVTCSESQYRSLEDASSNTCGARGRETVLYPK